MRTKEAVFLGFFTCCLVHVIAITPFFATPHPDKSFYFVPKLCKSFNFGPNSTCATTNVPGCVCYASGTCSYTTTGNECTHCRTSNNVSFNPNESCPNLGNKKITLCSDARPTSCPPPPKDQKVCECDDKGSCQYVPDDICNACLKKNIVSIIDADCSILQR